MFRQTPKTGIQKQDPIIQAALEAFTAEIARQEDIVYGVALFFECLSLLHADNPGQLETYRKQFRNIIQHGNETIRQARAALEEATQNYRNMYLVEQFRFMPCHGHPNPQELEKRAVILVETYNQVFPERSRSDEFTPQDTFQLIEQASAAMAPV